MNTTVIDLGVLKGIGNSLVSVSCNVVTVTAVSLVTMSLSSELLLHCRLTLPSATKKVCILSTG